MRPMKYRAYIKHLKSMAPVESINFNYDLVEVDLSSGQGDAFEYGFDEIELMQYTGLSDDKNIEVYEGDIVYVTHTFVENVPTYKAVVEWDKYRFVLKYLCTDKPFFNYSMNGFDLTPYRDLEPFGLSLKIIGNKFENPEFFTEKQ